METLSKKPVRILCLEDNQDDRNLLEITLKKSGIASDFTHVSSRREFESALGEKSFDLIISDFSLPSYDGMSALATARQVQGQTPFIFVSGTIGEERAVESLKNGATDYVLKDRRERLVTSVRRALRDSRECAERKQLEDQLRQAQKMEAIGQLAGGVAHDFNNVLAVIQCNAELALMNAEEIPAVVRENLTQITAASERAASLIRQLLAFSRKQAMRLQPVNLVDVIDNLTKMLKRIIGEDILLQCTHHRHVPYIQGDVAMMEQILFNLVVNARDAMPQGGDLLISTKKLHVGSEYIPSGSGIPPGDFICLRIRDTGCGIAPENLPRIFEPFFTTKEAGKGTGLGLATVYGIVKQHGGWVRVSSRVGKGTIFRIFLPSIDPTAISAVSPEIATASQRGSERILLVEDDASVRLATCRLLASFGYQVIEAASGREALEIWRNQEAAIDLLLTDLVLPGGVMGRELADELRKQKPRLKVVFVSGYSLNVIGQDIDCLKRQNNYFLQKPFPSWALVDMIRRCLDGIPA